MSKSLKSKIIIMIFYRIQITLFPQLITNRQTSNFAMIRNLMLYIGIYVIIIIIFSYSKVIVKSAKVKQQYQHKFIPMSITKIDINLVLTPKSNRSKGSFRLYENTTRNYPYGLGHQFTQRRLRYCYQKKQIHPSINDNTEKERGQKFSFKFNDTHHFYQANGSQFVKNQSNLLKNESGTLIQKQTRQQKDSECIQIKDNSNTRVVNFSMITPQQYLSLHKNMGDKKIRSKSSIQNSRQNSQSSKKSTHPCSKNINPYTNQEYLHIYHKEKQSLKKKMSEQKKTSLYLNILQPCKIQQKELNIREHWKILENREFAQKKIIARPLSCRNGTKKGQIERAKSVRVDAKREQEMILEGWEHISYDDDQI